MATPQAEPPVGSAPAAPAAATPPASDMAPLFARLPSVRRDLGPPSATRQVTAVDRAAFVARTGFKPRGGPPEIVVGAEVAVELGHPATTSHAALLWTRTPGLVAPGRVALYGPDLDGLPRGARADFGLLVLLELTLAAAPDPFALEQGMRLTNRLPGFMVRALPGRLWARIGATRRAAGLSLCDVGQALVTAYLEDVPGAVAAEVLLVTAGPAAVGTLAPLAAEARIRAGQHKKLALAPDGALECEDLDCDNCDERDACDSLRDVLARRRRKR